MFFNSSTTCSISLYLHVFCSCFYCRIVFSRTITKICFTTSVINFITSVIYFTSRIRFAETNITFFSEYKFAPLLCYSNTDMHSIQLQNHILLLKLNYIEDFQDLILNYSCSTVGLSKKINYWLKK